MPRKNARPAAKKAQRKAREKAAKPKRRAPRVFAKPMMGLFALLDAEQRREALDVRVDESFGPDEFLKRIDD